VQAAQANELKPVRRQLIRKLAKPYQLALTDMGIRLDAKRMSDRIPCCSGEDHFRLYQAVRLSLYDTAYQPRGGHAAASGS
jgi:hypothetical protein